MASSLILIFFKAAGVTFKKVGFLGAELLIDRPIVVYYGLWLVWAYFLVRYAQFMMESGDLGIRKAVSERITKYAKEKFKATNLQDELGQEIGSKVRYLGSMRWALVTETYQVERGDVLAQDRASFGLLRWLLWATRGFLMVTISSTKITEYLLPLALAFATAVMGVWGFQLPAVE